MNFVHWNICLVIAVILFSFETRNIVGRFPTTEKENVTFDPNFDPLPKNNSLKMKIDNFIKENFQPLIDIGLPRIKCIHRNVKQCVELKMNITKHCWETISYYWVRLGFKEVSEQAFQRCVDKVYRKLMEPFGDDVTRFNPTRPTVNMHWKRPTETQWYRKDSLGSTIKWSRPKSWTGTTPQPQRYFKVPVYYEFLPESTLWDFYGTGDDTRPYNQRTVYQPQTRSMPDPYENFTPHYVNSYPAFMFTSPNHSLTEGWEANMDLDFNYWDNRTTTPTTPVTTIEPWEPN